MSEYRSWLPEETVDKAIREYRDKTETNRKEKLNEIEIERQEAMRRSPGNKYIEELYEHEKKWWNEFFDKQVNGGINFFESVFERIKEIPQQKSNTMVLVPAIQKEEVSVEAKPKPLSPKEYAERIQLMMNSHSADVVRFQLMFLAASVKDDYGDESMAKQLVEAYGQTGDVLPFKTFRDPENSPYANKIITVLNEVIAKQDWYASHVKSRT